MSYPKMKVRGTASRSDWYATEAWSWECPAEGCVRDEYERNWFGSGVDNPSQSAHTTAREHAATCPALQRDRLLADLRDLATALSVRAGPYILDESPEQQAPTNTEWTQGYFRGIGSGLADARWFLDEVLDKHKAASS